MIPGEDPVLRTTEHESCFAALVMARIFLRDVIWWVLIRMRCRAAIEHNESSVVRIEDGEEPSLMRVESHDKLVGIAFTALKGSSAFFKIYCRPVLTLYAILSCNNFGKSS